MPRSRLLLLVLALFLVGIVAVALLAAARPTTPMPSPSPSATPAETALPARSPSASPFRDPQYWATQGLPDPVLTPGVADPAVTMANLATTVCRSGYTASVRPPSSYTNRLKIQQITAYGYTDTNLADYEEDHLISLELGGDPRASANLWPEPHHVLASDGAQVGSFTKDTLENFLHRQLCAGTLSLTQVQAAIARDWVTTWRMQLAQPLLANLS
jgi:hypothetical protein